MPIRKKKSALAVMLPKQLFMYLAKNRTKNHLFSIRELLFIFADFYFGYHLETFQEYDKIRIERQGGEPFLANAPRGGALPAVFIFEKICKACHKTACRGVYTAGIEHHQGSDPL